jgi:hypothetical protein
MLLVIRINQESYFLGVILVPKNIKDEVIQALRALEAMTPEVVQVPHSSSSHHVGILEVTVEG